MLLEDLRVVKNMEEMSKEQIQKIYTQYQDKKFFEEPQIEKIIKSLNEN